jgi:hypothetical protein
MVLKQGYSLESLEKKMAGVEPEPLTAYNRGVVWKGVIEYLSDKET